MIMKKVALHWQILIALFLAVIFGVLFPGHVSYVGWMGELFLRALKMIIIPLVFSSIVSGVSNIGSPKHLGRLSAKTFLYYISTSLIAILTGLLMVTVLRPGVGADLNLVQPVDNFTAQPLGVTLMKIIPENIISSFSDNSQMLAVIFFGLLFGFFITRIPRESNVLLTGIFNALFETMMKITLFVIRFTPLGIFGLVAVKVAGQDDFLALIQSLGLYMIAVILGLIVHSGITLPLVVRIIGKVNPIRHFKAMRLPLITAFSTASSNATLPLTVEAVKNNAGVSGKVSSFTLPLGATINMDGTALYECVAVIFIAQAYGIELTFAQTLVVVFTALLASIGAAGVPMAGLVMMTIVLTAVGLPLEGIGLILAVDRILDMFRTTVNVWSDTCGAVVIARTEGETLKV